MIQTKTHRKYLFTPLRYPGGKTSLFEFFDKTIKYHGWKHVTYIEPYAGGAGAALSLLLLEKVDSIVINDFDPAIFYFWKSILNSTDEFIDAIKKTPVTIDEWNKQKKIYQNPDQYTELEVGFATFYLNRTNRSGILMGAGPIGGKGQNGKWKIDARFNKLKLIDKIRFISLYKSRIELTNLDGIKVIEKHAKNTNSFFYVDPPYFVKGADLYLNAFKYRDHQKLASILNKHSDAKWLLSYDNEDDIRALYPNRKQEPFSLRYSAHIDSKTGSEIMIFSDSVQQLVNS